MERGISSDACTPSPRSKKRPKYAATSWRCSECAQCDRDKFMVGCDGCKRWFHGDCVSMTLEQSEMQDAWHCSHCEDECAREINRALARLVAQVAAEERRRQAAERAEAKTATAEERLRSEVSKVVHRLIVQLEDAEAAEVRRRQAVARAETRAANAEEKLRLEIGKVVQRMIVQLEDAERPPAPPPPQPKPSGNALGKRRLNPTASSASSPASSSSCCSSSGANAADGRNPTSSSRATAASSSCGNESAAPAEEQPPLRPAADGSYCYERRAPAGEDEEGLWQITHAMARCQLPAAWHCTAWRRGGDANAHACLLFETLTPDCIDHVLSLVPLAALLLSAVPTCTRFAHAAEALIGGYCKSQGWKMATRRARGAPASSLLYPWRRLLRTSSCHACVAPSPTFVVRRTDDCTVRVGMQAFRLCMACARKSELHLKATANQLAIAAIAIDGKTALFPRQFSVPVHGLVRQGGFVLGAPR